MSVVIYEYASANNFVESRVGEIISTQVFDESDTLGILGAILSLVSQKEDIKIIFDED